MAKCDLCGGDCRSDEMVQLLDQYQTNGVRDLCPKCAKWANGLKSDLLGEIPKRMREEIAQRLAKPARRPWWKRLLRA